jgi:hypothetical protein
VGPGQQSSLTGQWSTLTGPRPGLGGIGQGWIRAILGRSGPGRARHVLASRGATSTSGFEDGLGSTEFGSQWTNSHGLWAYARSMVNHLHPLSPSHGARCTECTQQPLAHLSPSLASQSCSRARHRWHGGRDSVLRGAPLSYLSSIELLSP